MQRQFKFRVWYKTENRWIETPDGLFFKYPHSLHGEYFGDFINDPYIAQQYIGLKDLNDKEIFEGDIVAVLNEETGVEDFRAKVEFLDKIAGYTLRSSKPCFRQDLYLVDKIIPDAYWNNMTPARTREVDTTRIKIIGNIFENSDIL